MVLSPHHQRLLLDAAREVIRRRLAGQPPPPDDIAALQDPVLAQPAGCFVSLHVRRTHELRGCVGRLDACDPLVVAVRRSAANVLTDPRFTTDPVCLDELPYLEMEVSVLSPLRLAPTALEFDLLNEGIYLTWAECRAGCFLPQVARETGWSREQLLCRLCVEKMGLPATAWQDSRAKLFVFTTQVIGPEAFELHSAPQ